MRLPLLAIDAAAISAGDTAWVLASTALVMVMTVGLAFFYGGLVRPKNALNTMMMSVVALGLISVQWVLVGYSIAFGHGSPLWGGLAWLGFRGVGGDPDPAYAATIPLQAHAMFQLMFAIITPALISGAIVERMRFRAYVVFLLVWATLIYDPLAHWVWGAGGGLKGKGALDFAGGTVVHISSGVSALAMSLVMGKRRGYGREPMQPHNLPLTVTGAALLWFGWFGFNAGSAVAAGKLATSAFVVTNTATAAAALGWMFTEWAMRGKPTVLGAASGAVAGLVAITPASGFVNPLASIVIGAVAGFLCYNACNVKAKLGYDDLLDVVGVHGIGGTWRALATRLFATKTINPDGADGLFYGNPGQMKAQIIAVVASWVLAFVGTVIILKVHDAILGLRVPGADEVAGLDLSQHSETAYAAGGGYGEVGAGHPGTFSEARPRVAH